MQLMVSLEFLNHDDFIDENYKIGLPHESTVKIIILEIKTSAQKIPDLRPEICE